MSFDDLCNNFKIVEQEVKGTANSSSSLSSQNMDFVSSPSSTNKVNTAYGVSTANTQVSPTSTQLSPTSSQVNTASTQVSTANLIQDGVFQLPQVETLCKGVQTAKEPNKNQDSSKRTIHVEETASNAMVAIDGVGFEWSYMVDD
uniref:Uncharacterized protein n=1 Tax=Tanacetum cinerariifolium TaxID=118510 RepID=A0A699RM00_TANCI|nr:hypothetical protein [Tanacetum cinerariifolium]